MAFGKFIVLIALASAAACGAPVVSPTPAIPPVVVAPVNPPVVDQNASGKAVLAVSAFTVQQYVKGTAFFQYEAKLQLIETGGKSGATLTNLQLLAPGGVSDMDCQPVTVRIGPGKKWDMATLGYCVPYLTIGSALSRVSFQATVTDDESTVGKLVITADVEK